MFMACGKIHSLLPSISTIVVICHKQYRCRAYLAKNCELPTVADMLTRGMKAN
jgi:hypothetical protein